jgi:hypothetical protein
VASIDSNQTDWLEVIGKALGFLCVQELARRDPERVGSVLQKVDFLEGLGIPQRDAAVMVGSTADSVRVMRNQKSRNTSRGKSRKK